MKSGSLSFGFAETSTHAMRREWLKSGSASPKLSTHGMRRWLGSGRAIEFLTFFAANSRRMECVAMAGRIGSCATRATGLRVFLSLWGFEEFDDVAGGIDADDLLASLVLVEFVPELHALLPQLCNV